MAPEFQSMPIWDCIQIIKTHLSTHHQLIIEAPPGAGKTTVIPLTLLNQTWLKDQTILMLEPRRLAARSAAKRMADLLNEPVGQTVGYQIRQESKISNTTKIKVITEGILTRWLQSDPSLEGVGAVIFDEIHERSLDADLGLALCHQAQTLFRDEHPLKIIAMSATLDGLHLQNLLSLAPIVTSKGKAFPISTHYLNKGFLKGRDLISALNHAVIHALDTEQGNILVFLPGESEINKLEQTLNSQDQVKHSNAQILPLYSRLNEKQQQLAISPCQSFRKVVLATNIAETSLTIEGIEIVIDSGLQRSAMFDANTGITRLRTSKISRSSATQRQGRAGRLAPGICFRLWSEYDHGTLAQHTQPEIENADLSNLVLQLFKWGEPDPSQLNWLTPPPNGHFQQAKTLLILLNALSADGTTITEHGDQLAQLPVSPRMGNILLFGLQHQLLLEASILAAIISEGFPRTSKSAIAHIEKLFEQLINQVRYSIELPSELKAWSKRVIRQSQLLSNRVNQIFPTNQTDTLPAPLPPIENHEALPALLLSAYPDRVAQRTSFDRPSCQFKMANGRSIRVSENDPLINTKWIIAIDIVGMDGRNWDQVFNACPVDQTLFHRHFEQYISSEETLTWDEQREKIAAYQREKWQGLILKQTPINRFSQEERNDLILQQIRRHGLGWLRFSASAINLINRSEIIRMHLDKAQATHPWPELSAGWLIDHLEEWLVPYLNNIDSASTLRKLDFYSILLSLLDWQQQQILNQWAPTHIKVPSGSSVAINYKETPPVLEVKLQEMFGCTDTPTILDGAQPLTLHLLSPAKRPLQITQNLATFWRSSYEAIKKEMKGRYPKHPWPDNPLDALPTKYTKNKLKPTTNN